MKPAIRRLLNYSFSKKKRVKQLSDAKIRLEEECTVFESQSQVNRSYGELRASLANLGWQGMSFDRLCGLPQGTIEAIEIQIKKDKFNVSDSDFYEFGSSNFVTNNQTIELNRYYNRVLALLKNEHSTYDQLHMRSQTGQKYTAQMYVYDLVLDKKLQALITYFINNLQFANKLEALAEPTLVKRLLALKRELIIQGVKFQSIKDLKATKKTHKNLSKQLALNITSNAQKDSDNSPREDNSQYVEEDLDQNTDQQSVNQDHNLGARLVKIMDEASKFANQVKILKVIGYEYEFWVDVKHNRAKNGQPEDYIIEQRIIDNPNQTMLLTSQYPTINVKYIIHKRKRKDYTMHFCTKAELQVLINGHHHRNVKIEWVGPSNKQVQQPEDFRIIDYEGIMRGNPTIKSVFEF